MLHRRAERSDVSKHYKDRSIHTRRKEKIMHPTKSHFPTEKGMNTQPLSSV